MEKTLSIIKPDAMVRNLQGAVLKMIQDSGLKIVAQKMIHLTKAQAQAFYAVHKERGFFDELCESMITSPVSVQVLAGNDAIKKYRDLMGATNPANADEGTIRKAFGESIEGNSVHGSDSAENAKTEISFFFADNEIFA